MKIDWIFIIGLFAAGFTTISFLPQVIKTHKTKHTKDISLAMFFLFTVGIALWFVYGLLIRSIPVILANLVTIIFSAYLLFMKIKYE